MLAIKICSRNVIIPQIAIEISKLIQVSKLYSVFHGFYIKMETLLALHSACSGVSLVISKLPYTKVGFLYAAFFVLKKTLKRRCCYCSLVNLW